MPARNSLPGIGRSGAGFLFSIDALLQFLDHGANARHGFFVAMEQLLQILQIGIVILFMNCHSRDRTFHARAVKAETGRGLDEIALRGKPDGPTGGFGTENLCNLAARAGVMIAIESVGNGNEQR